MMDYWMDIAFIMMYIYLLESSDELGTDDNLTDDEKEWKELQKSIQKEREQKKNQVTTSHIVHAPYFPAVSHHVTINRLSCYYE